MPVPTLALDSFTDDLYNAFGRLIASLGIGWTWMPTAPGNVYGDNVRGIYPRVLPDVAHGDPGSCAMAITPYWLEHDDALNISIYGVQFAIREDGLDPRVIQAAYERIGDALLGRWPVSLEVWPIDLARIAVSVLQYSSAATPEQDGNQRRMIGTVNYRATLCRPSPYRR